MLKLRIGQQSYDAVERIKLSSMVATLLTLDFDKPAPDPSLRIRSMYGMSRKRGSELDSPRRWTGTTVGGQNWCDDFEITEQSVRAAAEVELPRDKFENHSKLLAERSCAAHTNAGPVFEALLRAIPVQDMSARNAASIRLSAAVVK